MARLHTDQADGLRRLFGQESLRVVTFASGSKGVGKTTAVVNIAAAMARQGKEVLVIDENTAGNVAAAFGVQAKYDLFHVVNRDHRLAEVLVHVAPGVRVLPAARAVKKLGKLQYPQQEALIEAITGMEHPADVILVDTSMDHPLGFSPLGLAAQDTIVVASATGAAITEAYALIKKVSHAFARKHFRILVNKVRSQPDARSIYENIAQVAAQRGVARLDYAGAVPLDESLRQAVQLGRPVLLQAPDSPSAAAFRDIASDMLYWQRSDSEAAGVEQFMQQLLHLSQRITPQALRA